LGFAFGHTSFWPYLAYIYKFDPLYIENITRNYFNIIAIEEVLYKHLEECYKIFEDDTCKLEDDRIDKKEYNTRYMKASAEMKDTERSIKRVKKRRGHEQALIASAVQSRYKERTQM